MRDKPGSRTPAPQALRLRKLLAEAVRAPSDRRLGRASGGTFPNAAESDF
jgi:hypothetical protein